MIIFISGSINSGESTVVKLLAKRLDNAIVSELVDLNFSLTDYIISATISIVIDIGLL